jgi:CBS domain-containing protein
MKISDVLAAKGGRVITVWPSKRVDQLPQLFEDRGISSAVVADATGRALVVMQGGKVVGVVSIGDLVKARLQDAEMESKVLRELALGQLSAT